MGIVWYRSPPEAADVILSRADAAMYEARQAGKNRVVVRSVGARGALEAAR